MILRYSGTFFFRDYTHGDWIRNRNLRILPWPFRSTFSPIDSVGLTFNNAFQDVVWTMIFKMSTSKLNSYFRTDFFQILNCPQFYPQDLEYNQREYGMSEFPFP